MMIGKTRVSKYDLSNSNIMIKKGENGKSPTTRKHLLKSTTHGKQGFLFSTIRFLDSKSKIAYMISKIITT